MNLVFIKLLVVILVSFFIIRPTPAQAVIPPDFIFNIGTQVAQIFSLIIIFSSAIIGAFFQSFRVRFNAVKNKKLFFVSFLLIFVATAFTASYFYAVYKQKAEFQRWQNLQGSIKKV